MNTRDIDGGTAAHDLVPRHGAMDGEDRAEELAAARVALGALLLACGEVLLVEQARLGHRHVPVVEAVPLRRQRGPEGAGGGADLEGAAARATLPLRVRAGVRPRLARIGAGDDAFVDLGAGPVAPARVLHLHPGAAPPAGAGTLCDIVGRER